MYNNLMNQFDLNYRKKLLAKVTIFKLCKSEKRDNSIIGIYAILRNSFKVEINYQNGSETAQSEISSKNQSSTGQLTS